MSKATPDSVAGWTKPDYGIDAPNVMRNLFVFGIAAVLLSFVTPPVLHLGSVAVTGRGTLGWTGGVAIVEGLLFVLYVRVGKFRHRDFMLSLHQWQGDERVLDVGCGRGLLLAGAARHLLTGHATGLDIWSNTDMGGNSEAATLRNLELEHIAERCTLLSQAAQDMPFPADSFDVIMSNLCLHNIKNGATRTQALQQIARTLKPGGVALISDYRHTRQYAQEFERLGLSTERRWGNVLTTFPPLCVVIAHKPQ